MTVARSRAEEVGFIVREGLKEAEVGRSRQNEELDVWPLKQRLTCCRKFTSSKERKKCSKASLPLEKVHPFSKCLGRASQLLRLLPN